MPNAKIAGGTRVIGSERFDIDDSSELSAAEQAVQIITSPAPYIILILLALMIVMIFVDVMAISGKKNAGCLACMKNEYLISIFLVYIFLIH